MHRYMNHYPYSPYYVYPPYYFYPERCHLCEERLHLESMTHLDDEVFANETRNNPVRVTDHGKTPFTIDIEEATENNDAFRTTLWTGEYLQVTLMSIDVGEDIGLELHSDVDQFLRIEEGKGLVQMGNTKDHLDFRRYVEEDSAIIVPAGMWHNLINIGNRPLKLYSIYAPPEHPHGEIHRTKEEALAAEGEHHD